jgi:cytochrome b
LSKPDKKKVRGRVWDPLVRIFHWTLAAAFATAWFERSEASIHETAGKVVLSLIIVRTVWGLVGTASARFETFMKGPVTTLRYVWSILRGRPRHYIGHNPAGAAMIGLLLLTLTATTVSGILMTTTAFWGGSWIEWIHGTSANLSIVLIAGHLIGVAVASFQHKEVLPLSMVTGKKMVARGTPRYLGPPRKAVLPFVLAGGFAMFAFSVWAGGEYVLNGSLWRMQKILAAAYEEKGHQNVAVAGPRFEIYPVVSLHYEIALQNCSTLARVQVPLDRALGRKNPDLALPQNGRCADPPDPFATGAVAFKRAGSLLAARTAAYFERLAQAWSHMPLETVTPAVASAQTAGARERTAPPRMTLVPAMKPSPAPARMSIAPNLDGQAPLAAPSAPLPGGLAAETASNETQAATDPDSVRPSRAAARKNPAAPRTVAKTKPASKPKAAAKPDRRIQKKKAVTRKTVAKKKQKRKKKSGYAYSPSDRNVSVFRGAPSRSGRDDHDDDDRSGNSGHGGGSNSGSGGGGSNSGSGGGGGDDD